MNLAVNYPKLFDKFEDKELELRHLLGVDENYEDFDSEEYDYVIYIAEPIQDALGKEKMAKLMLKLHDNDVFENFVASEEDLYGVKTTISEEEIVDLVLSQVEEIV